MSKIKKLSIPLILITLLLLCSRDKVPNNPVDPNRPAGEPPSVIVMADTSVNINDSITITAAGTDDGRVRKYVWKRDVLADTTTIGSIRIAYPDSGSMKVVVEVIDDIGLVSEPDTCMVQVTLDPPEVRAMPDDSVNTGDSITITAAGTDNGSIRRFVWAKDGVLFADTTVSARVVFAWGDTGRRTVLVKAVDDDGVFSQPDTCIVRVVKGIPSVSAMADDSVNIKDTIAIRATGRDDGSIRTFIWALDGRVFADTTDSGVILVAWPDSGMHRVLVRVVDDKGRVSGSDTCMVRVTLDPPGVTAVCDSLVNIKDSMTITLSGKDNGRVVRYAWARNGITFADTTTDSVLKVAFATSGLKFVKVVAIDDDGVTSIPLQCRIIVTADPPRADSMPDTTVSFALTDSVQLLLRATDTANAGGKVVRYYWKFDHSDTSHWIDSCDSGVMVVKSKTVGGPVRMSWVAKDDDGQFSRIDTLMVLFNRPPAVPIVSVPAGTGAWKSFSYRSGTGTIPLMFPAVDPDGTIDTLGYKLFGGSSADSLALQYSGRAPAGDLLLVDTVALIFWKISVYDLFGDSAEVSGSFTAPSTPPPVGMKPLPGGTFQMGSASSPDEQPVRSVTISPFWMDSTEVTREAYLMKGLGKATAPVYRDVHAAEDITWYDAALYCNYRSIRDGLDTVYRFTGMVIDSGDVHCRALEGLTVDLSMNGYRLPTEAQWEYACRGETITDHYWGSDTAGGYAWFVGDGAGRNTENVAQKKPNTWGLYDMSGNVSEWCGDWYGSYAGVAQTDPAGAGSGMYRVIRGGGYNDMLFAIRSAARDYGAPMYHMAGIGFRVVLPAR